MRKNVEFNSQGSKIRGVLATPGNRPADRSRVAVMGGGWCYVKEIVLPHYAEAILKAGVAVLMFDYRGLGESEGEPRQHIDPGRRSKTTKTPSASSPSSRRSMPSASASGVSRTRAAT